MSLQVVGRKQLAEGEEEEEEESKVPNIYSKNVTIELNSKINLFHLQKKQKPGISQSSRIQAT